MQYGLFTMPSHPPECGLFEGHRWDLQTLRWADELGFSEGWIGEHHTAPWEPHPAPDLLIAQALMETRHIRLAPGGFLLPYHHPAELAALHAARHYTGQEAEAFGNDLFAIEAQQFRKISALGKDDLHQHDAVAGREEAGHGRHHELQQLLDGAERFLAGQEFELAGVEREIVSLED